MRDHPNEPTWNPKEIGTYYYTIDEMCSVNDLKEVIIFVCVCFFVFFNRKWYVIHSKLRKKIFLFHCFCHQGILFLSGYYTLQLVSVSLALFPRPWSRWRPADCMKQITLERIKEQNQILLEMKSYIVSTCIS